MATAKRDREREKELEDAVLGVCRKLPDGANTDDFARELPDFKPELLVLTINRMMQKNRMQLFQAAPEPGETQGKAFFKEISTEDAAKVWNNMFSGFQGDVNKKGLVAGPEEVVVMVYWRFKGLNNEEILLYQAVKAAGNMGLWTKDMKFRTNLAQPQITKILKVLEGRKLLKSVKDVNNPSRKMYILADMDPSRRLTGGAWYSDNQFDAEFIDVLRESCYKFISTENEPVTITEIAAFVSKRGFSKVELREEDVQTIVQTLLYDGRIDTVDIDDEERFRPAVLQLPQDTAFTAMPCGVCPVFNECRDGGVISPQTCVYYDSWLRFDDA